MPKVRVITGSYDEVLRKNLILPPPGLDIDYHAMFTPDSSDVTDAILTDITRNSFTASNGKTFEDHVSTWLAPTVSKSFSQGNITASLFFQILSNFIQFSPNFEKEGTARTEDQRDDFYRMDNLKNLSIAFYDDKGTPCGVNITYSTLDPELWTASIIRNTTSEPKDREVLIISPEEFINAPENKPTSASQSAHAFLTFLKSKQMQNIVKDVFVENGTVNIEKLIELSAQYKPTPQNEKADRLKAQYSVLNEWSQLTAEQFEVVKSALERKQAQNIRKAQEWYESELTSFYKSHKVELKEEHHLKHEANLRHKESFKRETSSRELLLGNQILLKEEADALKSKLDKTTGYSFFGRHPFSITASVVSVLIVLGLILTLTGVLAPLGLALSGLAATIGLVAAGVAAVVAMAGAAKIGIDEAKHANHQAELEQELEWVLQSEQKLEKELEQVSEVVQWLEQELEVEHNLKEEIESIPRTMRENYQRKLQEINPNINITALPEGKITLEQLEKVTAEISIDLENQPEPVLRAILAADFSTEEFKALCADVTNAAQAEKSEELTSVLQSIESLQTTPLALEETQKLVASIVVPGTSANDIVTGKKPENDDTVSNGLISGIETKV